MVLEGAEAAIVIKGTAKVSPGCEAQAALNQISPLAATSKPAGVRKASL